MFSFGMVVAANNLLALKNFTVFLANYRIFEKPSFWETWLISQAQKWLNHKAIKNFLDLVEEARKFEINVGLNDCTTGMFTILYIAREFAFGRMDVHGA